ncbi:uncharacterized protein LOC116618986 [Nematostella vectensis]|uniref:uncharacterized protein LOC116618986 n=1 Tax=Nematostella vectensis TaxID=45351 RepID=UPI00139058EA|nr:uncharacterized protein LOC116618986 [Nematostella vectensis]
MKPDLNNEYRHLCSSSSNVTITDQLFGDDLAKEVKELTEVNRVGKRVTTTNPTAYPRSRDNRNLGWKLWLQGTDVSYKKVFFRLAKLRQPTAVQHKPDTQVQQAKEREMTETSLDTTKQFDCTLSPENSDGELRGAADRSNVANSAMVLTATPHVNRRSKDASTRARHSENASERGH